MNLLTTNDVAKILRKDRHYIGLLRENGLLKSYRFGRGYMHSEEHVQEFLKLAEKYDLSSKDKVILAGLHERKKSQ